MRRAWPKIVGVAWAAALSTTASIAADAVSYRLLDGTGTPVAEASVAIAGRTGSTETGPGGSFTLDPNPVTPFELAVFDARGTLLGVAVVTTACRPEDRPCDVTLVATGPTQTAVVRGVAPETSTSPASATDLLSADDIGQRRPTRVVDLLEEIPGAENSGSGQTAVPSIRGLARGRTLLLIDGARVTTERRAGASATFLDPFAVERIEIARGPGSVAYGSDALGGVLHVRTPRPDPDRAAGRYALSGGVGVPRGAAALEWNQPVGDGAILAQVHARSFGDYDAPDEGEIVNSSAKDRGGLVRGVTPLGAGRLSVGLQIDRAIDVERPRNDTGRRRTVYPEERSDRLTVAYDHPEIAGLRDVSMLAFVGRYRLVTETVRLDGGTASSIERSDVDANDLSLRFSGGRRALGWSWRFGTEIVSRFGLEAIDSGASLDPDGVVVESSRTVSIESADRTDYALFLEARRRFFDDRLGGAFGLRGDRVESDAKSALAGRRSTSNGAVSGFVAIESRLTRHWEGIAQIARGFRDPTLSDRYFVGVTGRGRIEGNPSLDPETSLQLDLAFKGTYEKLRIGAYGYHYTIEDLIERFEIVDDVFRFRNRGELDVWGWEAELAYLPSRRWSLRAALGGASGELEDGTSPDDVPSTRATLSVTHEPSSSFWWRAICDVRLEDDDPGPSEARTPGYGAIGLAAGYRFDASLELDLTVSNLLDHRYPASADDRAPLAPGTAVVLGVRGRF